MTSIAASSLVDNPHRARLWNTLAPVRCAGSRAMRWWAMGFFVLLAAGAIATGIVMPNPRGTQLALLVYSFGVCILTMWLSMLLLVARDGRRLCLPGVVRGSANAMGLFAVLLVVAPALVVAASSGNVAVAILFPALAVATPLAYLLLPIVIASWLGFIPALYVGMHNLHWVPSPFDPRVYHWAWLALAILVAIDVLRWRQLLRRDDDGDGMWQRTMLMQMRGNMCKGGWWSIDQRWTWRRAADKKTALDLRGVRTGQPASAIAVALGGWYVPLTPAGRLASLARVVVPALLFIPLMLFMNLGHERSMHKAWTIIGVSGGLWIGLFGGAMLALMTIAVLQRHWKDTADLALLALLPGIEGDRAAAHVARATLGRPMLAFAVLWLCMLLPALVLHSGALALLLCTLVMLGMASVTVMAVLKVFAGRPLRASAAVVLGVVVLVLINVSAIVGIITPLSKLGAWAAPMPWIMVLTWLALVGWAAWQALTAWRSLQRRPHPFLANAP